MSRFTNNPYLKSLVLPSSSTQSKVKIGDSDKQGQSLDVSGSNGDRSSVAEMQGGFVDCRDDTAAVKRKWNEVDGDSDKSKGLGSKGGGGGKTAGTLDKRAASETLSNSSSSSSSSSSSHFDNNISENSDSDSDDISDDEENEEEDDGESEDSDDIFSLPRRLYLYAADQANHNTKLPQCLKALETAKSVIFEMNPALCKLLKKALERGADEKKVPPGSAQVQRKLEDDRYLLSLVGVVKAKLLDRMNDETQAIATLREALVWFPRNVEANYLLATLLKATAMTASDLQSAETLFAKAVSVTSVLKAEKTNAIKQSAMNSGGALTKFMNQGKSKDKKEDKNEDGEDDAEFESCALEAEIQAGVAAQEQLSLYLLQAGRYSESRPHLEAQGFTWRLSAQVLNYALPSLSTSSGDKSKNNNSKHSNSNNNNDSNSNSNSSSISKLSGDFQQYLRVFDNALPPAQLAGLAHMFRPTSPFWSEHEYDVRSNSSRKVGYFSYLYKNLKTAPPRNRVEEVVKYVYHMACKYFPEVSECDIGEWWVHSRPHSSGHQLHYDSDETSLESGQKQPVHPVVSVVMYVSGEEIGGPTLMTNQVLGGPLADKGWMCHPGNNRILMFDAKYLHGVVPGKGASPAVGSRRLTFMIGFWKKICASDRGLDSPGPGQPYPDLARTKYTWPNELAFTAASSSSKRSPAAEDVGSFEGLIEVDPMPVSSVWEPCDMSRASHKPCYSQCFQGF